MLRQQIKNVGDRPLLWSTLGQSLMKHGEWQEASLAFRAALKQRPDAYDYAWLADALDRLHKPEEAAAMRRDGLMLTLQNKPPQINPLARRQAPPGPLWECIKKRLLFTEQALKTVCMTTEWVLHSTLCPWCLMRHKRHLSVDDKHRKRLCVIPEFMRH